MANKVRVLILAEAANPEWTSVPLLGWFHAKTIAKVCDAHLVTQVRNKEAIENMGWVEGREFTSIDTEKLNSPLYKLALKIRGGNSAAWTVTTAINSIAYPYFERLCWKKLSARLKNGDFDVVHRITPVSPTAPSYIAKKLKKIGVPFVVGPLNGGVPWPSEFRNLQHKEKEWLSYIRNAYKILPGYKSLRKNASCIIAGSMATKNQMLDYVSEKLFYLPENAIDTARFNLKNTSGYELPIRAAFVGRLVPYKGADMAIDAMADLCRQGKMVYDIYGSGPEQDALQQKVEKAGLGKFITVHGFVPNEQLQEKLVNADIFVFPSVREFGGGVIIESMALGVVPVIVDYAGPAELVTDKEGYLIPMGTREQVVENLKSILTAVCDQPLALSEKREQCLSKVAKYYTWEAKAEQLVCLYDWVLGRGPKPDFHSPFV